MTLKRIPLLPTLLVLVAVGVMVRLGFWQLDRLHQKEVLLAQYAAAQSNPQMIPSLWAERPLGDRIAYRRVQLICPTVVSVSPMAGRNAQGEVGWAQVARCSINGLTQNGQTIFCLDDCRSSEIDVVIGWSKLPSPVQWPGGIVTGMLAPANKGQFRVIADPPLAGLQPNARPDPKDLPNNHLSYAIQWFLFALTALVIYALALRKRLAAPGAAG